MAVDPIPHADKQAFLEAIAMRAVLDNNRLRARAANRLEQSKKEALRLARALSELDGIQKVIHFGSSASGRNFRLDSDIDLAIVGGDILDAVRVVESSSFRVDIIDIETVPSPFRDAVIGQGDVLYEKR